jgi:ABC-type sugar transport system substrate-binding protein
MRHIRAPGFTAIARRALFAAILTLSFLAAPLAAEAQQPSKVSRIGVIGEYTATDPFLPAYRQGLRELGYTEG